MHIVEDEKVYVFIIILVLIDPFTWFLTLTLDSTYCYRTTAPLKCLWRSKMTLRPYGATKQMAKVFRKKIFVVKFVPNYCFFLCGIYYNIICKQCKYWSIQK